MTPQEWEAALAEARRAKAAAEQKGEAPIAPEEANEKSLAAAREVVDQFRPKPESFVDAVGQTLRATTASIMDPVRAAVGTATGEESFRNNLALERAKTRRAVESIENVSPNAPLGAAKAATNMAAMAAYPPALGGVGSSLATGAALGMGSQTLETYEETGKLPSMMEELGAAAEGAAGAGIGMLVGSGLNYLVTKALGAGKEVPAQLARYLEKQKKVVSLAESKMQKANVQVKASALNRMVSRIDRMLSREYTQSSAPKTREAFAILQDRAAQGGDISLLELNQIRRRIRDFDTGDEAYGGIKTITDQINRSINGLPMSPATVASGDARLGVSAWNSLNRNHIQAEKANVLVKISRVADQLSRARGWSFSRALQEQTNRFINLHDRNGKALNMFSKDEQELLHNISKGEFFGNSMNAIDNKLGHGAIRMGFDWSAGLIPRIAAEGAARNKLQTTVDNMIYNLPAPRGMLPSAAPGIAGMLTGTPEGMPQGMPSGPMNLGELINSQGGETPTSPLMPPALGQKSQ